MENYLLISPYIRQLSYALQNKNCCISILDSGTREAAFVHALSSAAVAVAVTRACTRGELERCGCDRKVRGVSPEGESGFYCMKCNG